MAAEVTQVVQPMSPAADKVIGPVAETATVPLAFGKVIVRAAVGSVTASVVLLASAVAPSKTKGEAPVTFAAVKFKLPFAVKVCTTVKAPLLVVTIPLRLTERAVAFAVPKLRTPAESTVRFPAAVPQVAAAAEVRVSAPAVVDRVEAAPPVNVRLPPEVNCDDPVGVRLTDPAPVALKFPEASVKRIAFPLEVVIVPPLL